MNTQMAQCGIPSYMHGGLEMYLNHRVRPGNFLSAILENDLMRACACADEENRHSIFAYANYLYNFAPSNSYGSVEKVEKYLAMRAEL